jgi:hypothetical protein
MANTIIEVDEVANIAVDYLYRKRGLVGTLYNAPTESAFAMNKGETVNVPTPASFTAASYNGSSYTVQDINQSSVSVVLNKDYVVPVGISLREKASSANDIEQYTVAPIMDALLKQMDADILTEFDAGDTTTPIPEVATITIAQMELGIQALKNNEVDPEYFAVSNLDGSNLRQIQAIYSQDANRLNDNRSLAIGSYGGMDIFDTTAIASTGVSTSNWMYHSSACTVAMRPLNVMAVPGVQVATASYQGMAITVTEQWNSAAQRAEWVFRCLYGVKTLDGGRIVKVITDGTGD